MGGIISTRADKFAQRLRPPAEPPDTRSVVEKMADFSEKYNVDNMLKSARNKVKEARNA